MPPSPFEVFPPEPGMRMFRVLRGETSNISDFLSDEQEQLVTHVPTHQSMAIHRGFSVRATLPQARRLARFLRRTHVAELALTWEEGDAIARTFSTPGHHTVWAHPDLISQRVIAIHPTVAA